MLLNDLLELKKENLLDYEHLKQFSSIEIIQSVITSYNDNNEMDYDLYSNIITVTKHFALTEEYENPLFERFLLLFLYLQSKGVNQVFMESIIILNYTTEALFKIEKTLSKFENFKYEFNYIVNEYNNYMERRLSPLVQQANILKEIAEFDQDKLEEAIENLKNKINLPEA